jgi:uncharacterized membrane protein
MSNHRSPKDRASSSGDQVISSNIKQVAKLEEAVRSTESMSDRMASHISTFCGSMLFVWVHVVFFGAWILLNTKFLPKPFDPYPFTFLTLVVSLEAIFLSTFIMIAENRQERLNERRSQLDLQINILAEQESTKALQLLTAIAQKLSVDFKDDVVIGALEKATQPESLAREIEKEDEQVRKNGSK